MSILDRDVDGSRHVYITFWDSNNVFTSPTSNSTGRYPVESHGILEGLVKRDGSSDNVVDGEVEF